MAKLKKGCRVRYLDPWYVSKFFICGTIVEVRNLGYVVRWDDGQLLLSRFDYIVPVDTLRERLKLI